LIPLFLGSIRFKDIAPYPDMLIAIVWFNREAIPNLKRLKDFDGSDVGEVCLWTDGKYYYSSAGYFIAKMSKTDNSVKYGLNGATLSGVDEILRPDNLRHSPDIRQCLIDSLFLGIPGLETNMSLILKDWPTNGHSFGNFRLNKVEFPVEVWVRSGANFLGLSKITIVNRKNDHTLFQFQVCVISRLETMLDDQAGISTKYFRSDQIFRKLPVGTN